MRRSGMCTFVPPGSARAIVIRSLVQIFLKTLRFISAVWNSLLVGGSTATFLILRTYAGIEERSYARRRANMLIGEPLRTIVVEPLELPVQQPISEPEPGPVPEPEPEQVPVTQ